MTPIRPDQQHLFCLFWEGLVYLDRAVCFGMSSSAGIFGAVADMLVAIYRASGFPTLLKWVDNFFAIRLPGEHWSEDDVVKVSASLGVPWAHEKMRPFASRQRYIGFDWDLGKKTVSLPFKKLESITSLVKMWCLPRAKFSAHDAAHLHGKLVHISCILPLI